jgi:hypothetical protein
MFKNNKYTKHYYLLINKAKSKNVESKIYQKHHIVPKSLGGSDSLTNLVKLTPREHYIAHLLLTKMTDGINKQKMFFAFVAMNSLNRGDSKHINSRFFERCMVTLSKMLSGENNPAKRPEVRKKISSRDTSYMQTEKYKKILSEAHTGKQIGGKNPAARSVISPKGEIFETIKSAAEFYKMPWTTLQYWIRKNKNGWSYYKTSSSNT